MRTYIVFIILFLFVVTPSKAAVTDKLQIVGKLSEENITLYAKERNGLYYDFKLAFNGTIYSKPFWISTANPTYAPQMIYEDINKDDCL